MEGHPMIEQDSRSRHPKSVAKLPDEEIAGRNVIQIHQCCLAGGNGCGPNQSRPQREPLEIEGRTQNDARGRWSPNVEDRGAGHGQQDQPCGSGSRTPKTWDEYTQTQHRPGPQSKSVRRNKSARLGRTVILDEAEVLRHDVKRGTQNRTNDHDHGKGDTQVLLPPDHVQMKYWRKVCGATVPP